MQKSLWLLAFSLFACTSDPISPDLGLGYYPIALGDYRIYDVNETTYVDKVAATEQYQQRESFYEVIETAGQITYILRIERRENEMAPWASVKTVKVRQTNQFLEYHEDNQSFIRMTYPIKFCKEDDQNRLTGLGGAECAEWDGNVENQRDPEFHHYRILESGDFTFGETDHIKLVLSDFPANIVKRDQRYEIYASGVGLVERSYDQVEFCISGCSGTDEIQDGSVLLQRLIEYGSE